VLSYLPDEGALDRALVAIADALEPGGILAIDLCGLDYAETRRDAPNYSSVEDDWAIITRFSLPSPQRFVRDMTTFVRGDDGTWRRDDERHDNVLVDVTRVPALLAEHDVDAHLAAAFGAEDLPDGLHVIVGHRTR
jgi:hypothetical protein